MSSPSSSSPASTAKAASPESKTPTLKRPGPPSAPTPSKTKKPKTEKLPRHVLEQKRNAVLELYFGRTTYAGAEHMVGKRWLGQTLGRLARAMDPGLIDDELHLQATRAANAAEGIHDSRGVFTTQELRNAILAYETGALLQHDAAAKYGVSERTLRDECKRLRQGNNMKTKKQEQKWDKSLLRAALLTVARGTPGPKHVFTSAEGAMFLQKTVLQGQLAKGLNQREQIAALVTYAHDTADILEDQENVDPKVVKKLRNVKGSTSMLASIKDRAKIDGLSPELTNRKTSQISHKRAQAADPERNKEMFQRYFDWTVDLYKKGKISRPYWRPNEIWGGDEMGFDPNGQVSKVLSFVSFASRLWTKRTGEKAPFWVTLFFWLRTDGQQILPPCLCHQGKTLTEDMLCTFFSGHLPETWVVYATESGYANYAFFKLCMVFYISSFVRL